MKEEQGWSDGGPGTEPKRDENYWQWQEFKTNVQKASETGPDRTLRGRRFLDLFDRLFRKLDGVTFRFIPEEYHPFIQAGAIANFMFAVAVLTGFLLLIWYSPSVHLAYDSVAAMSEKPFTAELVRSLHRYSSDLFILFVLFHAFKVFFGGRFTGSRWLAWVTGIVGLAIIWFDGWLGYWLVWDDRGAMIAVATARMVDLLPFFSEPLTASFLTDDSFNSTLFLIVFFLHMLIPIAFGVAIWLHVARLSKPLFFPTVRYSSFLFVFLAVISLIWPADIGERAELLSKPESVSVDYFYLLPLLLTERLQGGVLWLLLLGTGTLLISIPWILHNRKDPGRPVVDEIKCNGCTQCFQDCPYNAIAMLPRESGNPNKSDFVARIDPSVCVSCGICVGSCDPVAIDYPDLSPWEIRNRLDEWLDREQGDLEGDHVAFVCGNSAGSSLQIDSESGYCVEMPGYRVFTLPCAGWIHPVLIERAFKRGAAGVLVSGCESDPDFRLGADWLGGRIEGERHPELRRDRLELDNLLFLKLDKPEFRKFLSEAARFRERGEKPKRISPAGSRRTARVSAGVTLAAVLTAATVLPSSAPLPLPERGSELVISFKKAGHPVYSEREDRGGRLAHMQRGEEQRRVLSRSDVRLRVDADGERVVESSYRPGGLFRRGYSSGIVTLPLDPGNHRIEVRFGYPDPELETDDTQWIEFTEYELEIESGERIVLKYDQQYGFRWYDRRSGIEE